MGDTDVTSTDVKNLYLNVRTNTVVAVLDKGENMASIATVVGDGVGRSRSVRASSFRKEYLASDGHPHTSGYVPLTALPEGHPNAVKAPKTDWSTVDIDDIDQLDNETLAEFILEQERIKKAAADLADRAKVIAKARRGDKLGLDLRGDIALVFTSGKKFDAKLAARSLTPVDYQRILLPKPDATMARKIFENEPDKLEACMKDNGATLTVRRATDEDRAKFQADAPQGDEDYSFEH